MFHESGRFDFPLLKCQGCVCRARDVMMAIAAPLIPSDMGHILELGETGQHITIPLISQMEIPPLL